MLKEMTLLCKKIWLVEARKLLKDNGVNTGLIFDY